MQMLEETAGTFYFKNCRGADEPDLYAEHVKCVCLVDELNDAFIDRKSKVRVQERVRSLLAVLAEHFRHEEELFAQYGYLDGPRHCERHAQILARYQQLAETLDGAAFPAAWIECGSLIGRMLEDHLEEEKVIYAS